MIKVEKPPEIKKIQFMKGDEEKRKNLYRTRETKTIFRSTSFSPEKKPKITNNKALQVFFRNQLFSLIALMNRREDYINYLRGKNLDFIGDPLKQN